MLSLVVECLDPMNHAQLAGRLACWYGQLE